MGEADNTKVVQEAYAAFGRGDVQGILDRLDEGIVWRGVYGAGSHVPMSGERKGKAAVTEFFKQVSQQTRELQEEVRHHQETEAKLKAEIAEREVMEAEVKKTHQELLAASRQAGMAEVATSVCNSQSVIASTP